MKIGESALFFLPTLKINDASATEDKFERFPAEAGWLAIMFSSVYNFLRILVAPKPDPIGFRRKAKRV